MRASDAERPKGRDEMEAQGPAEGFGIGGAIFAKRMGKPWKKR